jgi:hypothetical protein
VSGAASVRCERGEERAASGRGLATTQRSEAAVVRPGTASPPAAALRGVAGVGAREGRRGTTTTEVTTPTGPGTRRVRRGGAMRVGEADDNYGGGDDNYPRVVVEMRDEGREEDVAAIGKYSCR